MRTGNGTQHYPDGSVYRGEFGDGEKEKNAVSQKKGLIPTL